MVSSNLFDHNPGCLVLDNDNVKSTNNFTQKRNDFFLLADAVYSSLFSMYLSFVYFFQYADPVAITCVYLFQYADPVADLLDTSGCFRSRLFRESCVFFKGNYVKVSEKFLRGRWQFLKDFLHVGNLNVT